MNARPISDPLTVRDCCLVTDGGGAIVMTSAERARAMGARAVYRAGLRTIDHPCGHFVDARPDPHRSDPVRCAGVSDGRDEGGGYRVLALYDAFTINTILFLEDLGFARKARADGLSPAAISDRRAGWR